MNFRRVKPVAGQEVYSCSMDLMKTSSEATSSGVALDSFKSSEEMSMRSMANQPKQPAEEIETSANCSLKQPPPIVSNGAVKSLRSLETVEPRMMENQSKQFKDITQTSASCCVLQNPSVAEAICPSTEGNHPKGSRPIRKVGAFTVYNSSSHDATFSRTVPVQGLMFQVPKTDFGISKSLDGKFDEHMIPLQCGHGCCEASSSEHSSHKSLLGPKFVEYEDFPTFSSLELTSLATDLNNIAWVRRDLENAGQVPGHANDQRVYAGTSLYVNAEENTKIDQFLFEGRNLFSGMTRDVASSEVTMPIFTLQA